MSAGADVRYLTVALALIAGFMAGELVAAVLAGSLALFADAGHMLTDVAALAASVWAARLAARPAGGAWTYGLKRAEILSAAGNGITLLVMAGIITVEAARRLTSPPEVTGSVVLAVAVAGAVVNVAATAVLARANRASLNVRGAFAHILTDLYAFAGTAAGLVILLTGWARADAVASLFVAALMGTAAWGLLRDAGRILLQAAPDQLALDQVRAHLVGEVDHVRDVHDLHAWTVTSGLPTLSAHIVVDDHCFTSGHAPQILDSLQHCLTGHFDVEHSTFQLEPAGHLDHEKASHP